MEYIELIGVAAFAVSGAMTAIEKGADIFGVLFLAVITALGGGVIRDILLGLLPPVMFTNYEYVLLSLISGLVVFLDAYIRRDKYRQVLDKLDSAVNVFDAVGLAVFTVSGMDIAINSCGLGNPILIISLGMTTGVGGGMLRDVLTNRMPRVLCKRVYAVASLCGAGVCYIMLYLGVNRMLASVTAMLLIFALRICATKYRWNLPQAKL